MIKSLVSVVVTAYNQEKYIEQTLESILEQNTNFEFEILIGEDCSLDRTKSILQEYEARFPSKIKVIYNSKNLGIVGNWTSTINHCNSKYVALCEGDDYWTDRNKLQKQIDFLENNNEFGMVCSNYSKYFEGEGTRKFDCFKIENYKEEVKLQDYIHDRGTIMSATVVFYKSLFDQYQKEIPELTRINWKMPDSPLWLFMGIKSRIGVIPDSTAEYRIHKVSGSKMGNNELQFLFVEKGYEIPLYFADKYNLGILTRHQILRNRQNFVFEYAFFKGDKELYIKLKHKYYYKEGIKNNRVLLFDFGFLNKWTHKWVVKLFEFKRSTNL